MIVAAATGTGQRDRSRQRSERLVLSDGRAVTVRPIRPDDGPALRDAIADADPETIRLRFLGGRPTLDDTGLRRLVEVDYSSRLALVAIDDDGHGVAIVRYEGKPGSDTAEVAIAVSPGWRRVGLASHLLVLLGIAAHDHGIRHFTATYLAGNHGVARLVASSGLPERTSVSIGIAEVEIDLSPEPIPVADQRPTEPPDGGTRSKHSTCSPAADLGFMRWSTGRRSPGTRPLR